MYQRPNSLAFMLTGAALFLAAACASAACIEIAGLPPNDVVIQHCAPSTPTFQSCDMNGVQNDHATHGTIAVSETTVIASWTRNTIDEAEEYVCIIDRATALGAGAVHVFAGLSGVPKDYIGFDCRYRPTDCPD